MKDSKRISARVEACDRAAAQEREFQKKYQKGLSRWSSTSAVMDFLAAVHHAPGKLSRPILSNARVRRSGLEAMLDGMLDLFDSNPDKERYLGTFCWDQGITWEDKPHVDLAAMQLRVYKALRNQGLTGFTIVEVDLLRPLADGSGQRLLFHIHCVVWRSNGKFKPRKTARKLSESRSFPNELGARSVDFRKIGKTVGDYARVGSYLFKLKAEAKNRLPKKRGGHKLRSTQVGFSPASAVRLVEILSHISIFDTVRGVGEEGKAFVKRWKRAAKSNMKVGLVGKRAQETDVADVASMWAKARRTNGSKRYQPCTIITSSNK